MPKASTLQTISAVEASQFGTSLQYMTNNNFRAYHVQIKIPKGTNRSGFKRTKYPSAPMKTLTKMAA